MQIVLYHNDADPRVVYKGTKLTSIATVDAEPFYPMNVVAPTFRLKYNSNVTSINYCYVSELGRYYYVKAPTLESGRAMIINCECDVLMSFKTDILNLQSICVRNENNFNEYIQDDIPSSVKATTTNYRFGSFSFSYPQSDEEKNFVMVLNGLVGDSNE